METKLLNEPVIDGHSSRDFSFEMKVSGKEMLEYLDLNGAASQFPIIIKHTASKLHWAAWKEKNNIRDFIPPTANKMHVTYSASARFEKMAYIITVKVDRVGYGR